MEKPKVSRETINGRQEIRVECPSCHVACYVDNQYNREKGEPVTCQWVGCKQPMNITMEEIMNFLEGKTNKQIS